MAKYLRAAGDNVFTPKRVDPSVFKKSLGHLVYCIGVTGDFREKPYETVRAHVCYLSEILERTRFESLLYLSSARVYGKARSGKEEDALQVETFDPSDLYNLSKLMGEALCFSSDRANVRIARLSNVYGRDFSSPSFLTSIIRDAVDNGRVVLNTAMECQRDYISIKDVVSLLRQIALRGRHQLYNVASGINVSNRELLQAIRSATGCRLEVAKGAEKVTYPRISINRLKDEFSFSPSSILDETGELVSVYRYSTTPAR